jgi:hypothetical protein
MAVNRVVNYTDEERCAWQAYAMHVLPYLGDQLNREELEQFANWKLKAKTRIMLDQRGVKYSGLVFAVCHHDENGDALPHNVQEAAQTTVWARFYDTDAREDRKIIASKPGTVVTRKQADDVVNELWATLNDYICRKYPI